MTASTLNQRQIIGLFLGPVLFLLLIFLPVPAGLSIDGLRVAAVAVLMATFWMTEAIPIPATALFPIALFPILGVMTTGEVTKAYGNHLIYLFMGGFLIAVTIEKWQLHRRIALHTIRLIGVTPKRIILGFMLATAFLSSWISNTATAMMMVTIGLSVLRQTEPDICEIDSNEDACKSAFGTSLMLGIAYSASIGGVATLIGTPPNAILAGVLEKNFGYHLSFYEWMLFALPLSMLMLIVTWYYLTHIAFKPEIKELPGGRETIRQQLNELGPIKQQEIKVLVVFTCVAAGWLTRGLFDFEFLSAVTDSSIAILGAILLFIIPADFKKGEFLLDWRTALKIPWDIIILFGGGFALASGFAASGLTEWLANQLIAAQGMHTFFIILLIVLLVVFLTEITSNTATASLFLPIMGAFAITINLHPTSLMVATALAASFAFMLPVATPPNAIVFSSRQISIPQMVKAGIWLNLFGALVITLFVYLVLPFFFEING